MAITATATGTAADARDRMLAARVLDLLDDERTALEAGNAEAVETLAAVKERAVAELCAALRATGPGAYPGGAGYSAAKFGVTGLSKVMRAELRDKGVRVCCVFPGATVSPSWKSSGVDEARMMPARDVARAFLDVYRLSRNTVIEEIVLRPQRGDV